MDYAFASLAHINVLLLPVGAIQRATFDKLAAEISQFVEIRLSDVPADSRDDRARFMPNPLATGSLFLKYIKHPPSHYRSILNLFRPSDFPLGVIGIASCTQTDVLSSIYSQFVGSITELLPPGSVLPLAQRCFVFEEGDGNTNLNIGNNLPGLVVIPSMMGNKKLYIGTLLAELCSNILGEFSIIVRELESLSGNDFLSAGAFGRIPNYKTIASESRPSLDSSPNSFTPNGTLGSNRLNDPRLNLKRSSTLGPGITNATNRNSQLLPSSKKRQSAIGTGNMSHARLYKVLGDLFLLSGRTMDASIWYNEAIHGLKQPQDMPWQASALEGIVVAGVIDCWLSGHGLSNQSKDLVTDLLEKLTRASALYSSAVEAPELEGSLAEISLLYITSCFRHCSLLYHVWVTDTTSSLSLDFLLHGTSVFNTSNASVQKDSITPSIGRSDVAAALGLSHGPWILHLGPRERIEVLRHMAKRYSDLQYRRKETYILRELLACIMDCIVQGREEGKGSSGSSTEMNTTPRQNVGDVAFREADKNIGNSGILSLIRYVCGVHGINLVSVDLTSDTDSGKSIQQPKPRLTNSLRQKTLMPQYSWIEIQVGLIREALAIAESLPDYAAVAQFASSALRELHLLLDADDQYHFHTVSSRAMVTVRRRGDDRKLGYWLEELVYAIRFIPPPFAKMPSEKLWSSLKSSNTENGEGATKSDPFLFNPRRMTINKRQAYAVANELLEFVVTLENPYHISLEILRIELSTSGVPFKGKAQSLVLQGDSTETITLTGQASESGTLMIRGCKVTLPGVELHETLLPILSEEEEEKALLNSISLLNEKERKKPPLSPEQNDKNKHTSASPSEKGTKPQAPPKYLELRIVPEQPTLRIRRTSLSNGAVMLYEGESSMIRLIVENISLLPIDYIDLAFEDSTKATLEQMLTCELSAFDTYETEYSLVSRPVFSWDPEYRQKSISPGKESAILVRCYGKSGCTDGTINITYSYTDFPRDITQDEPTSFFTRQLLFPVIVSVYQMLECTGLSIMPVSQLVLLDKDTQSEWYTLFKGLDEHEWCLLVLDVQNTYGLPFEVTVSNSDELSQSKLVPPGANYRLLLPVKRFSLPESTTTQPIPSLTGRQFVVTGLEHNEDDLQKTLFWYRDELLKRVRASWKEASGTRTGELSLRQQRFTLPMLNSLRTDDIRIDLSLSESMNELNNCSVTIPNSYVGVMARVKNLRPSSAVLSLTITAEPADYVVFHGVLRNIPLGRLQSNDSGEYHAIMMFVSQGQFAISAEVREIRIGEEAKVCGSGELKVTVQT